MAAEPSNPLIGQLDAIFEEFLVSPNALRETSAKLAALVEEEGELLFHRSHPANSHSKKELYSYLSEKLRVLFSKPETKVCGLATIECLLNVEFADINTRTILFSGYLSISVFVSPDTGEEATRIWGLLISNGCGLIPELVEQRCKTALEWLNFESSPIKRKVACLLLVEIATRMPSALSNRLDDVYDSLSGALRDPLLAIRSTAAAALHHALSIALKSNEDARFDVLMGMVIKNFYAKQPEIVHGALLTFNALLDVCSGKPFAPAPSMTEAWSFVIQTLPKSSIHPDVRKELLLTLPLLAKHDQNMFVSNVLSDAMNIAVNVWKGPTNFEERSHMFLVVGKLGSVLGDAFASHVDKAIRGIETNLVTLRKQKRERCPAAVTCLAMLATADPKSVRPHMSRLLEPLFSGEPTVEFAQDLKQICNAFPELHSNCMDRMLALTKQRMGQVPKRATNSAVTDEGTSILLTCLDSMMQLDLTGYSLVTFLSEEICDFFTDPHPQVRREAVKLCAALMLSGCTGHRSPCCADDNGVMIHSGLVHIRQILKVQRAMIAVAVTDADSDIRKITLELLRSEFDQTLALQDCVRSLFPGLNDKHANRHVALRLLGRLSRRNPGCVFPMLRKIMVQCTTELQYFINPKKQEQATMLLGTLVDAAPTLIRPYIGSLLNSTIDRLHQNETPSVVTALLSCIDKIVRQVGENELQTVCELTPTIVGHITGSTSTALKVEAIRALGSIVRATGDVNLYDKFPELLPALISPLYGGFKESWLVRKEILTLLGIIGAVDPVHVKGLTRFLREKNESHDITAPSMNGPRGDDVTAQIVISAILQVLQLPSTNDDLCSHAVTALVDTFTSKTMKLPTAVSYIPRVIPEILRHIHIQIRLRDKLFRDMTSLVSVFRHFIRSHLPELIEVIKEYINCNSSQVLAQVAQLLAELRNVLNEEFKPYLPSLLPLMVQAINEDRSNDRGPTFHVLHCFEQFGKLMDGQLHIVLPAIVTLLSPNKRATQDCRVRAIATIVNFARQLITFADHAPRCIHALCRILDEDDAKLLHQEAQMALLAIVQNLGGSFDKYIPLVRAVLSARFGTTSSIFKDFFQFVEQAKTGKGYVAEASKPQIEGRPSVSEEVFRGKQDQGRFEVLFKMLERVDRSGEDEWKQWLRQFSIELLKASPSSPLRVCVTLAQLHEPFARQLFYPAFASCYLGMEEDKQRFVAERLGHALSSKRLPTEVLQELLNLGEYMERIEEQPQSKAQRRTGLFDVRTVTICSEKCNLHAKAVHYLESQFIELTKDFERGLQIGRPTKLIPATWKELLAICEKIISLCNLLGQQESANGVLHYIQQHFAKLTGEQSGREFTVEDPTMYEKLQWWSQSLYAYQEKLKTEPMNPRFVIGVMTAYDAIGDFPKLLEAWKTNLRKGAKGESVKTAALGARAAWLLQKWDELSLATSHMGSSGYSATTAKFYQAVLAAHSGNYSDMLIHIDECRKLLDADLSALIAESYDRAYNLIVGLQQLSELEELGWVKQNPPIICRMLRLWEARLRTMAQEPSVWQGTLSNHSLAVDPQDELAMWLQFVTLCRSKGRQRMSEDVLQKLLGGKNIFQILSGNTDNLPSPKVVLAGISHQYELGNRNEAVSLLNTYLDSGFKTSSQEMARAQATCKAKLGEWLAAMNPSYPFDENLRTTICTNLGESTTLDSKNGTNWHHWAHANHEIATKLPSQDQYKYVQAALLGYLNSVVVSQELQDVLGFLSLWFTYGEHPSVDEVVVGGIHRIDVSAWLGVIPQIIARIHTNQLVVTSSVQLLLTSISQVHPQALLYPLNVNMNFRGPSLTPDLVERRKAAQTILSAIVQHHAEEGQRLVFEAQLVTQELNRCAMLWCELWYDELHRAWERWTQDYSIGPVWEVVEPLQRMLLTAETPSEEYFVQEFGKLLTEACGIVGDCYKSSGFKSADMSQAWELFRKVVGKIDSQIQNMQSLYMQFVSPKLVEKGKDLLLVVPGHYSQNSNFPRISAFVHTMKIISSKQHPRRLKLTGNDGQTYQFLLKGHEDMRQDERVMQLFGLANTLMESHPTTKRRDCNVQIFSITPLGDMAGLSTWVDHCDTLHAIIKEYRKIRSIPLDKEQALMAAFVGEKSDSLSLTVIQKVEMFEYSQENTDGMDVSRAMWMKAQDAESWLDKRTTYVRSLATISMVGHILGLGDRHPCNLMLHGYSGRIFNIDFGDCFEVAQQRQLHPEKVPFRLTRMLVKAMDIGGIEGLYKHTCESVMAVLREEKNSVLAMLEAFVHDPYTWRMLQPDEKEAKVASTEPGLSVKQEYNMQVGSVSKAKSYLPRAVPQSGAELAEHTRRARTVLNRIKEKLTGTEFVTEDLKRRKNGSFDSPVDVNSQVVRLIRQATATENLCQHYVGWCPFW